MKTRRLLAITMLALQISTVAQAGNIIRAQAPVIKSSEAPVSGKWVATDPSYGSWLNNGGIYGCSNWAPPLDAFPIGTTFIQNASDCQQDQIRTVQAREIEQVSGQYRDVGQPSQELRTISATAQRQAVGTKEYWVMIAPTYTNWANVGEVYGCTNWTPDPTTVTAGQSFTQTATDCKQNQERQRQDRAQETTTNEIRNEGSPVTETQTLSNQPGSRQNTGTDMGNASGSFYRIYISANNGNSYAQMAEVELIDSNGVDYFDQYTVTTNQSSYYATSYKADQLIDNSGGNNKWTSASGQAAGSWVTFKLPVAINPKTLVIWNYSSTSESARQPKDFSLQKSSDNGSTWVTVKTFTGQTSWLANEKRSFSLE